jgi:hypothetical protein
VSDATADNGFLTKSLSADTLAAYVTAQVNLNFGGDTGAAVVNLDTQSMAIEGTANEIETVAIQGNSRGILQIGLPDSVTITNNLTIGGDFVGNNGAFGNNLFVSNDLTVSNETQTTALQVDFDATIDGLLTMGDEIDMVTNRIINLGNPINAQDAATKQYVDIAVTGLLEFKGTFNAATGQIVSGTNAGAYIYNCPGGAGTRVAIAIGDYYIVTNQGGQFYCSGDLLQIGDSIVASQDAAADSSTVNDWGILEGNNVEGTGIANTIPLWTDSQVLGISNITQTPSGSIVMSENLLVDQKEIEAGTMIINGVAEINGELDKGGSKIVGLADPTSAQDAATKAYVDGLTTTNADDIAVLQTDVSTNTTNISTNASAITGKVDKAGDTMTGDLTILKTTSNPVLRVQSEETVGGNFQTAIINLRAKETSTNTETFGQFQVHGPNSINTGGAGNVVIANQSAAGGQVVIASKAGPPTGTTYWNRFKTNGQVQFEEYGSGTLTGTAAYNISVDASGNLIETASVESLNDLTDGNTVKGGFNGGNNTENLILGQVASNLPNLDTTSSFGGNIILQPSTIGNPTNLSSGYRNILIAERSGTALTTGSENIAIGTNALNDNVTGNQSVAIGVNALALNTKTSTTHNTAVGTGAAVNSTTGQRITSIGAQSGWISFPGTGDNITTIGYQAWASSSSASNEITLGNSSVTALRCAVTSITSLSDERDKKDITDLEYGLDFIESLQPKQFVWDNRTETAVTKDEEGNDVTEEIHSANKGKKDFGFIAQDVQPLDNDVLRLVYDENPDKLEMSYGKLVPILVKAVKELSDKVKALENV